MRGEKGEGQTCPVSASHLYTTQRLPHADLL